MPKSRKHKLYNSTENIVKYRQNINFGKEGEIDIFWAFILYMAFY